MERKRWIAVLAICAAFGAGSLLASDAALAGSDDLNALSGLNTLSANEMAESAGGSNDDDHNIHQFNYTEQSGAIHDNAIANSGLMVNGTIYGNAIQNSRGIVAVMQNSGNFANMNYSTSVIVNMY